MNLKGVYKVALWIDTGRYYDDMSWSEIDHAYNGMGAEWMPEAIREWLDEHFEIFRDAVIIHDCDYERGLTEVDKEDADKRLRRNMRRCIRHKVPIWRFLNRWRLYGEALLMYEAVHEFGDEAFWQGKRKPSA